jgi:dihydrofolate reductase
MVLMSILSSRIIARMACDPLGVIGSQSCASVKRLPWNCSEDIKDFLEDSYGHVMIMGRKTLDSVPISLLYERKSVVFSHAITSYHLPDKCIPPIFVSSLEDFIYKIDQKIIDHTDMCVIGGAELCHMFLQHKLISKFILTKMHKRYNGDTYLNLDLLSRYDSSVIKSTMDYDVYVYDLSC